MEIRQNSTNFDKNQHSVYIMYYHLILVVKYRRKVFDTEISDRAKAIFEYIAPGYGITMEEWNHASPYGIVYSRDPSTALQEFMGIIMEYLQREKSSEGSTDIARL